MTAGEISKVLAVWKDVIERSGRGFPTDGELADLLLTGAAIESKRIEAQLRALFERDCPAFLKLKARPWVLKVQAILEGRGVINPTEAS